MRTVVIYGIGKYGKEYVDKCLSCGIENILITDSNAELWGKNYRNVTIQSPENVLSKEFDKIIIAVGEKYEKEILNQLRAYNVSLEKIVNYKESLMLSKNEIYNIGDLIFEELPLESRIFTSEEFYSILNSEHFNGFEKFFFEKEHRIVDKWLHYFEAYEKFFSKYKERDVVLLEIGVSKGGSLQMWKNYFQNEQNKVMIYGIDIDPKCKALEEENIKIFIGSQEDRDFLREVKKKIGKVDILIDDGGHFMSQQITALEELFDLVNVNGVYLCEDTHTSYMKRFGGEYRGDTFIEYSKNLIDYLHTQYSETDKLIPNNYSEEIKAITFYDSMIFIEKKSKTTKSISLQIGNE